MVIPFEKKSHNLKLKEKRKEQIFTLLIDWITRYIYKNTVWLSNTLNRKVNVK